MVRPVESRFVSFDTATPSFPAQLWNPGGLPLLKFGMRIAFPWWAKGEEGRVLVIDLGNVAIISQEGESALLELMNAGAKFRCSGVLTRHVIQELRRRSKSDSSKATEVQSAEEQ